MPSRASDALPVGTRWELEHLGLQDVGVVGTVQQHADDSTRSEPAGAIDALRAWGLDWIGGAVDSEPPASAQSSLHDLGLDLQPASVGEVSGASDGSRKPVPEEIPLRSGAFYSFISRVRWCKQRRRPPKSKLVASVSKLADAWDVRVARHGDRIDRQAVGGAPQGRTNAWAHGNTLTMEFVARHAFSQIGSRASGGSCGEVDIDGGRRGLECMLSVCALATRLISSVLDDMYTLWSRREAVFVNRFGDSTPILLKFGSLQDLLMPLARYLKQADDGRWTSCSFAEYRALHPKCAPKMGIVEVFASSALVHWASVDGGGVSDMHDQEVFAPPRVLQRATGDCTFTAMDSVSPALSIAKLSELRGGYVFLNDVPDNSRANLRFKKFVLSQLPAHMLYDEMSGCIVHKVHTYLTKAMREDKLVGHLHATQSVLSIAARREAIIKAMEALVDVELEVLPGPPPPEDAAYMEELLRHTTLREQKLVRGRAGHELHPERRGKVIRESIPAFKAMANGNLRRPKCQHYEQGCCLDAEGRFSRAIAVNNFVAALLGVGILLENSGGVASKARWLSSSLVLASILLGFLTHSILPRSWAIAWPQWHIDRAPDETDDFHRFVKSKIYRSKLWMHHDNTAWSALATSLATAPAEHLMRSLQHRDARGGLLASIADRHYIPPVACAMEYSKLLRAPLTSVGKFLASSFRHMGDEYLGIAFQEMMAIAFSLAARIWFYLESMYDAFPYRMLALRRQASVNYKRALDEFKHCPACCVDRGITLKMRASVRSLDALAQSESFKAMLELWAASARLCNMATERMLALIRKASPARCSAQRLISAGFLSLVRSAHTRAGGRSATTTTRSQLMRLGLPLRCAKRRGLAAKRKRADNRQHVIASRMRALKEREGPRSRAAYLADVRRVAEAARNNPANNYVPHPGPAPVSPQQDYENKLGNRLFGLSSVDHPLMPHLLLAEAHNVVGAGTEKAMGLTARLGPLRQQFMKECFVSEGRIPKQWSETDRRTCPQLHPGVCARDLTPQVVAVSAALVAAMRAALAGTVCSLRTERTHAAGSTEMPSTTSEQCLFCHGFAPDQSTLVVVRCPADGSQGRFALDLTQDGLPRFQCAQRLLMELWRAGEPTRITLCRLRSTVASSFQEATSLLPLVPPADADFEEVRVLWPLPEDAKPLAGHNDSELDAGVMDLCVKSGLVEPPEEGEEHWDDVAIQELEKSMACALKRRRRALARGKAKPRAKAMAKKKTEGDAVARKRLKVIGVKRRLGAPSKNHEEGEPDAKLAKVGEEELVFGPPLPPPALGPPGWDVVAPPPLAPAAAMPLYRAKKR